MVERNQMYKVLDVRVGWDYGESDEFIERAIRCPDKEHEWSNDPVALSPFAIPGKYKSGQPVLGQMFECLKCGKVRYLPHTQGMLEQLYLKQEKQLGGSW